jgi:hypothetical protein
LTLPAAVVDAQPIAFDELNLDPALAEGVRDRGFANTTPVQSAVFPIVASGRDLIASAETGSGKTAAYLLPVLDRLVKEAKDPAAAGAAGTRVLVLGPTRELVVQIEDDLQGFVYHTGLTSAAVFGGTPMAPQSQALEAGVDIVVATPGRLIDHLRGGIPGFDRIDIAAGDFVFVAGAGPIGLLAMQMAKHCGASRVLVSEPHPSRRDLVAELGADLILDPTTDDVPAAVRDATRGLGADICIEAAGVNPAFQACIDSVRDSGTILVLSLANPEATFDLKPYDLFSHELRIVGSNTRLNTFQRALDLVPLLDLEPIVTEVLPLSEAVTGVRRAKAGEGAKIVLDCRGGN